MGILEGKNLLITGVLTDQSIAFHVARVAQEQGCRLGDEVGSLGVAGRGVVDLVLAEPGVLHDRRCSMCASAQIAARMSAEEDAVVWSSRASSNII